MINLSQDIQSLSNFKRHTNELINQMKETGHPIILTIDGQAELVVQDARSYQELLDKIEQLETIIGIRKGLEDLAQGQTQSLSQFVTEMQEKTPDKKTQEDNIIDEENPWIKLAGKYQNDPQYDEVLQYIEQYRGEINAQNEPSTTQTDGEIKQVS